MSTELKECDHEALSRVKRVINLGYVSSMVSMHVELSK